jgi:prophage regulatory protein
MQITATTPTRLLRLPEVRSRVGLSGTTIWRLARAGQFPRGIRISPGAVAWREGDIESWIRERVEAGR